MSTTSNGLNRLFRPNLTLITNVYQLETLLVQPGLVNIMSINWPSYVFGAHGNAGDLGE